MVKEKLPIDLTVAISCSDTFFHNREASHLHGAWSLSGRGRKSASRLVTLRRKSVTSRRRVPSVNHHPHAGLCSDLSSEVWVAHIAGSVQSDALDIARAVGRYVRHGKESEIDQANRYSSQRGLRPRSLRDIGR